MPVLRIYHVPLHKYSPPFAMCSEPLEGVDHIRSCPGPVGPVEVQLRAGWRGGSYWQIRGREKSAGSVSAKLPPFRVTVEQYGAQVASPGGRL